MSLITIDQHPLTIADLPTDTALMNSIIGTPALSASHPRLPLLQGSVPAGFPSPAADYVQNTIDLHERLIHNPEATFFIQVSGDSMIDTGIVDGSVLIVDASRSPVSGDIVVASIDGQFTVKRLKRVAGRYELHAENERHPYPVLHPTEALQIFGVVTSHIVEHATLKRPRR